ncbi:MAG: hypothetical protein HY231_24280 [Acidobacteria bacterium]|nr:hypothetical protein [Acidobacteriota bacterium]
MKIFDRPLRLKTVSFAILAMVFLSSFSARSLAYAPGNTLVFSNVEKHVLVQVEIHGQIDGHTMESVAQLVADWLEAAHFVVSHTDGAGYLHLHVKLELSDNHHFLVHSDCADWHEDREAAVVDAIDEILHHMVSDFIDKYSR